jgi:hypothetical protein
MGWTAHENSINKIWKEELNKVVTQEKSKIWERSEANELRSDGERS